MHCFDACTKMIGINVGCDAMTQVENMAWAVAITFEYLCDAISNRLRRLAKHCRIQVAL